MLREWNENLTILRLSFVVVFITMLILNLLTYYTTDDYSYMYSFATGKRIESINDIFLSMKAHAYSMNGRLIAHFFVQLFLMYPPIVFDLLNALMYVGLIGLLYKYCCFDKTVNVMVLWIIIAVVWYFVPSYGQVFLWLDGSCNYLWGIVFSLAYVYPHFEILKARDIFIEMKWKNLKRCLYIMAGALIGGYLETASFGVIVVCLCICFVKKQVYKQYPSIWAITSILSLCIGFASMISCPGTLNNKVGEITIGGFASRFVVSLDMYMQHLQWLLVAFMILFVVAIYKNYKKEIIFCAVVCLMVSLVTNFMHSAAAYYPERNMLACTVFLVLGLLFLFSLYINEKNEIIIACIGIFLFVFSGSQFIIGSYDITTTYKQCMYRNIIIEEEKSVGNVELELPVITVGTKYSAKYELKDLDTSTSDTWPNNAMAKYYGVESIIGIEE